MSLTELEASRLEQMMNSHGLRAVMEALGEMAAEKAEQVRSERQDQELAEGWDTASDSLFQLAVTLTV